MDAGENLAALFPGKVEETVVQRYRPNKVKTAINFIRRIRNWPAALGMKLRPSKGALRLLEFRDGLTLIIRVGQRGDEAVMHEMLFAGGYRRALSYLSTLPEGVVLDLGANFGLFSLLAARTNPKLRIHAYEPGPENIDVFKMNLLANPRLKERITLISKGVAGRPGKGSWSFVPDNPGASGFFSQGPHTVEVELVSLQQALEACGRESAFVKMDIEGSEFDIIRETPHSTWQRVSALAFEVHEDPRNLTSQQEFFARLQEEGFQIDEEDVISYFAHRN
jgi:FkbM family methyltransferase